MFCDRCGAQVEPAQNFCPKCGRAFGTGTAIARENRIATHVRLLGILWLGFAALRLIGGGVLFAIFGREVSVFPPDVPAFLTYLMHAIGSWLLISGVLSVAVGWGLLSVQRWARMLAIVMGCLNLIDIPFGTALGIYTLWVLLPVQSQREYERVAQAA